MHKIILRKNDDWEALYIDGKKVMEGHSLKVDQVFQNLFKDIFQYSSEYFEGDEENENFEEETTKFFSETLE